MNAIVALEEASYAANGMQCYGTDHVAAWLEVNPAGLFVAEHGGNVVGYTCTQTIHFEPGRAHAMKTHDIATDCGYIRRTHRPDGNSIYGLSICSSVPGASREMFRHICAYARENGKAYYMGFSRIPGFDKYAKIVEDDALAAGNGVSQDDLALWYAHACIDMVGGGMHDVFPPRPRLSLPVPEDPDPVFCKYLKVPGMWTAALVPGYMQDPESRDYGICMAYATST